MSTTLCWDFLWPAFVGGGVTGIYTVWVGVAGRQGDRQAGKCGMWQKHLHKSPAATAAPKTETKTAAINCQIAQHEDTYYSKHSTGLYRVKGYAEINQAKLKL